MFDIEEARIEALRIAAQQYKTEITDAETVAAAERYASFLTEAATSIDPKLLEGLEQVVARIERQAADSEARSVAFEQLVDVLSTGQPSRTSPLRDVLAAKVRNVEFDAPDEVPDGCGSNVNFITEDIEGGVSLDTLRLLASARVRRNVATGMSTWTDVFFDHAFTALAENEPSELRFGLVELAVMVLRWIDALDQRGES